MSTVTTGGTGKRETVLLSHAFGDETRQRLEELFPEVRFVLLPASGEVPRDAEGARVLLRKSMPHDALHTAMDGAPHLAWIHTASAGFNWVLTPRVAATDIVLTRTADVLNKPIAEFVVALYLALLKGLPAFLRQQRERDWRRPPSLGSPSGGTAVVLGAGAIGRETAVRLGALGMRVLGVKRDPAPVPGFDEMTAPSGLRDLLPRADLLVIACPLTPETHHLVGAEEFALMKRGSYLVNIARGPVVVEGAMIAALQDGTLAGAGLDVFDTEPLPADNPLWALPNVIVTPHVSYLADQNEEGMIEEFGDNLRRFLDGRPLLNALKSRELGY
jgi:phosphoglycerate dehydrogenase-like enzyme